MLKKVLLIVMIGIAACSRTAWALDQFSSGDPFWVLLHEPVLVDELKLSDSQQVSLRKALDDLDLRFWPLRNQSVADAQAGMNKIYDEARKHLKTILKPQQSKRLDEILLWKVGISSLLRDDVAERLRLSTSQRQQIKEIIEETQKAVTAIEQQASKGEPRAPLEKKFTELKTEEQFRINKLLKAEQRKTWIGLIGKSFDVTKLGNAAFKAPELVDSGEWINSAPLASKRLRGKVVVLHFYACGCINCIHNYLTYHEWSEQYQKQDVVLIGIHTPETQTERDIAHVRSKAAEAKFKFPVLIDVKSENWNAWGNSMWPTVYVIDKRGYLRTFWPGELKWQGAEGDKYIGSVIDLLLAESAN